MDGNLQDILIYTDECLIKDAIRKEGIPLFNNRSVPYTGQQEVFQPMVGSSW